MRLPERKAVMRHDQYGKAGKGIAVCRRCHATLFRKEWHHPEAKIKVGKHGKGDVHLDLCPACKMIEEGLYEGEIRIKNVPPKYRMEVVNLISAFGRRAMKRDIEDRVIEIKKQGSGGFVVTTTENQMAVQLAKKINKVFGNTELKISYSKEPYEVSRTEVIFKS